MLLPKALGKNVSWLLAEGGGLVQGETSRAPGGALRSSSRRRSSQPGLSSTLHRGTPEPGPESLPLWLLNLTPWPCSSEISFLVEGTGSVLDIAEENAAGAAHSPLC